MRTRAISFGIVLFVLFFLAIVLWAVVVRADASSPSPFAASGTGALQVRPDAEKQPAPNCDPNWYIVQSPNPGENDNLLSAADAISASDVWAVGFYNNGSANVTLTEHWNGSTWSVIPSPNVGTYENYLNGVDAVSSSDVWAVGGYRSGDSSQTLIEHWNGSDWSVVPSPNVNTYDHILYGVDAISGGDVWAVGRCDCIYSGIAETLVEHWDGTSWSIISSPNIGQSDNDFYAVNAVGSNDVWAAGNYYTPYVGTKTLIEHWNGNAWSIVSSPNADPANNILLGLASLGSTNVWAVGAYGGGIGVGTLIEHWNGNAWSIVSSPNPGANGNNLQGISILASDNIWVSGEWRDNSNRYYTLVEHWDGSAWHVAPSETMGTYDTMLASVAAIAPNDIWAVGSYDQSGTGTMYRTVIEHYSGVCVTLTPTPIPTTCAIQYSDVPAGSTFYPYIHCLACQGIVSGYGDGTFRPNNPVTRGQLSKIVSNAAGFHDTTAGQQFQDVPENAVFYPYIYRLVYRGYINGYPCGGSVDQCVPPANLPYFRPNNKATRGQISKIVSNAAGFSEPPSGPIFQDVPINSTYFTYTYRLASHNVMSGYPCGAPNEQCVPPSNLPYFRPNVNATRGQTSKIVSNTFFPSCDALHD